MNIIHGLHVVQSHAHAELQLHTCVGSRAYLSGLNLVGTGQIPFDPLGGVRKLGACGFCCGVFLRFPSPLLLSDEWKVARTAIYFM